MERFKADIIAGLRKELLSLQGFKTQEQDKKTIDLGSINSAFPNNTFPQGAIHEVEAYRPELMAAGTGFISGIVSMMMQKSGASIWISASRHLYPPALIHFGIDPARIVFFDLKKPVDLLWATEEALKCEGLSSVIAELPDLNFVQSRRFQLAVEKSKVTGFVFRKKNTATITAAVSRWKIESSSSETIDNLPGIGNPRWKIELMKIRNGVPGKWEMEWRKKKFVDCADAVAAIETIHRKAG